jgi:predicted metal-binding protein
MIEKELLELEHRYGGRAFAYVGKCLYCPDSECARKCNRPCLHPDKVRPSLEAFGFDIARTLSELFGIELLWGKNDILPEYLVLVSGLFHNSTENIISHTKRNPDSGNL